MFPFVLPRNEAKQHIGQQCRPNLPADGIFVVTNEVGKLKCLFDFLEKYLNRPTCFIQIANRACRPVKVVGNKCHALRFLLHFNNRLDQAQRLRIPLPGALSGQPDHHIPDNIPLGGTMLSHDSVLHVILGASDPKHAAQQKLIKMWQNQLSKQV